jgi:16S rRNA (guanine527-N7)-methyltransferase
MVPGRKSLAELVQRSGIILTTEQLDQLWTYHRMLRAANPELNLTRIHNFESMVLKHYVDSLLILRYEDLPPLWVDMGSGAGLPGIPLAIARPGLDAILAEPRRARADFLEEVCRRLGLPRVEVFAGKVGPRFRRTVGGVISRAVAAIPETLDRVAHCLEAGGRMLFMKGPGCDSEIAAAAQSHTGTFRLVADHHYQIPGTPHDRRLVVYERLAQYVASGLASPITAGAIGTHVSLGPVREISSAANPIFKRGRELLGGRGIRKQGRAILAGPRLVADVLALAPGQVEAWLTGSAGPPPPGPDLPWYRFSDELFHVLDCTGTHAPLLLVKVPELTAWSDETVWPEGCTLFIPFQDPENVGAVIRSAAAFGVAQVVLLRGAAHPFHPRSSRAAGPALFQVPLHPGPSIEELRPRGAPLIALATDGPELAAAPWPERFGLVAGIEGPGLPEGLRVGPRRHIAIAPGVESLNAATATAIALYAWRQACRET